jgi:hypothetical protein
MARYELAQMNVARLRTPLDLPQLADFVNALDRVNMSVWRDPQSLQAFVYRSDHAGVMRPQRGRLHVRQSVSGACPAT